MHCFVICIIKKSKETINTKFRIVVHCGGDWEAEE